MDGLRINREMTRRVAREALGIPPTHARVTVVQLLSAPVDEELLALPEDTTGKGTLQDATTGAPTFMMSLSALDGPDPLV